MTLLGIGAFPGSHPLNLGMMGMHGEAWVNQAIQQADLLIALGMRFDDRVTGKLAELRAAARSKIHVEIDPAEINKNVPVDVGLIGDVREVLEALLPGVTPDDHAAWLAHIDDLQRPRDGARHPALRRRRPPLRRARHPRSLAGHARPGARRHRRRPAPDVGGAVLPARVAALAHHLGRPRHRWASRCRRRSAPSSPGPTPRSGRSSATAASR